jgi:pimeloyl-ACP methyl ester carboxylesterase
MDPKIVEIARPGGSISALDWGGPQPVLLMLHAGGLCAGAFDPLARRLTDVCRPVAVDLRGHGASTAPKERAEFGYAALAADVFAVLDALGVESAVGLGNSLGGGVLLRAAVERPGFFSALLLCEAAATSIDPNMLERRVNRMGVAASKRRTVWEKRSELVERYAGKRPFDLFSRESLEAYARWASWHARTDSSSSRAHPRSRRATTRPRCRTSARARSRIGSWRFRRRALAAPLFAASAVPFRRSRIRSRSSRFKQRWFMSTGATSCRRRIPT